MLKPPKSAEEHSLDQLTSDNSEYIQTLADQEYYLAVIYREQKDYILALKHLDRATELYDSINHEVQNVLMLHERALTYILMERGRVVDELPSGVESDDYAQAQQWLDQAYKDMKFCHHIYKPLGLHL